MLAGQLANRGLIDESIIWVLPSMLYRACVQRCMYKRNTVYSIPCHNAQRNMWARPAVATIKFQRDAVNTEIGAKRNTKRRF